LQDWEFSSQNAYQKPPALLCLCRICYPDGRHFAGGGWSTNNGFVASIRCVASFSRCISGTADGEPNPDLPLFGEAVNGEEQSQKWLLGDFAYQTLLLFFSRNPTNQNGMPGMRKPKSGAL